MSLASPVIGLVGVGAWGRHILRDLRSLGAIVHAAGRHETSVQNAKQGGAASVVDDPRDLPAECEGFVIANRTVEHLGAIEALLPRGLPIFSEKPLCPDLAAARRLPPSAERLVFVMHKWRYHPAVLELARIAAQEEFGPVVGLRTMRVGPDVPHSDVNAVWVLVPHDLSIALEILGEVPRLVSNLPDPLTPSGGGAISRLTARNGAVGVVIEISSGHARPLRRITLACRDAVCELSDERYNVVEIRRRGAPRDAAPIERTVGNEMPLLEELRTFLAFLSGGPEPKTCWRDELKILEVIEGVQASL